MPPPEPPPRQIPTLQLPLAAPLGATVPDSAALMRRTCYALLPSALVLGVLYGAAGLSNLLFAVTAALLSEAALLRLSGRPPGVQLRDGSAVLSACILGLALAPGQPWWIPSCGAAAALCVKHAYGGLGHNPFNPAMAGYALLLVAFPQELRGALPALSLPFGTPAMLLNLGFLAGGLYLLALGICRWEAPCALLATLAACTLWQSGGAAVLPQLLGGATMLGAFFVLSDPVTGAATRGGRLLCGAATGVLLLVLRSRGLEQGGIAFAVLLVNFATPMLNLLLLRQRRGSFPGGADA